MPIEDAAGTVKELSQIESGASQPAAQGARYPEHLQKLVGRYPWSFVAGRLKRAPLQATMSTGGNTPYPRPGIKCIVRGDIIADAAEIFVSSDQHMPERKLAQPVPCQRDGWRACGWLECSGPIIADIMTDIEHNLRRSLVPLALLLLLLGSWLLAHAVSLGGDENGRYGVLPYRPPLNDG